MTQRLEQCLRLELSLTTPLGLFIGESRARLLEAIARLGSISRAARCVPMSYKTAWNSIDAMNHLAPEPLVLKSVGGHQGGAAHLTAYGHMLVTCYRTLEGDRRRALAAWLPVICGAAGINPPSMTPRQPSEPSQLNGTIAVLEHRHGAQRLLIDTPAGRVEASSPAAGSLPAGLQPGMAVGLTVPAPAVAILTGTLLKTSADNLLAARILQLERHGASVYAALEVSGGQRLGASIPRSAQSRLGLHPGLEVAATFSADCVRVIGAVPNTRARRSSTQA